MLRYIVTVKVSPEAGKPADPAKLVDVPKLMAAYYEERPDPKVPTERVIFGTSGHRGSSFDRTFNEWHILAITHAICQYRRQQHIDGPLFIGRDTHALSEPALATALEVLAANDVQVMTAAEDAYTPTPAISHAILTYNRGRTSGLADGIVITPSHNPPEDGGFKYNPPHGGPAGGAVTSWIEGKANESLASQISDVKRVPVEQALRASSTHRHNYLTNYVNDLASVLDMAAIRSAGIRVGVDPLGGAGIHYWGPIADRYGLNLTVVNDIVDPTFRFMTVDWDGRIRMDPSSPYAMQRLIGMRERFDIAVACDPDHDRHGIVTKSAGLLPPNHYLSVCIHYLCSNRPKWSRASAMGKTVVSSSMIDRVVARLGRKLYEVPVGFKWFVDGLLNGSLGFTGEESAGASFLRLDGTAWSTDKDGIIAALLAAEITARAGRDPGELYQELAREMGDPVYERIDAPATLEQKTLLAKLSPADVQATELAGEPILHVLTSAPGDGSPIVVSPQPSLPHPPTNEHHLPPPPFLPPTPLPTRLLLHALQRRNRSGSRAPKKTDPRAATKRNLDKHIEDLSALQRLLYASNRYALLLIFQAMDAAGKDGAIKHVMSGVNPQGCQVFSFKHPSAEELEHDFLWRTTRALARARAHRHLQPLLLRRGADRSGASGDPAQRGIAQRAVRRSPRCGMGGIARSWTSRATCTATARGSSSSSSTCRRKSSASVSSSASTTRQELEVQPGRRRGAQILEATTCGPTRHA